MRIIQAHNLVDERTRYLEREAHLRHRLNEEVEKAKVKANAAVAVTNNAEGGKPSNMEELERVCEEYKALLKCASCNIRFKSHVILRCMHVFCQECLDMRINTRQRKCPNCSEGFGVNDVRQIYL